MRQQPLILKSVIRSAKSSSAKLKVFDFEDPNEDTQPLTPLRSRVAAKANNFEAAPAQNPRPTIPRLSIELAAPPNTMNNNQLNADGTATGIPAVSSRRDVNLDFTPGSDVPKHAGHNFGLPRYSSPRRGSAADAKFFGQ